MAAFAYTIEDETVVAAALPGPNKSVAGAVAQTGSIVCGVINISNYNQASQTVDASDFGLAEIYGGTFSPIEAAVTVVDQVRLIPAAGGLTATVEASVAAVEVADDVDLGEVAFVVFGVAARETQNYDASLLQ